MKNQHEAVIAATKSVLAARFQEGVDVKGYASKEDKHAVVAAVVEMFQSGEASMSDEAKTKYSDAKSLKEYTAGLVTNWWNKSKDLNGGMKYEAKNPGARAGSQDEQVKEMKNLKVRLEAAGNVEGAAKVAEAITQRIAELKVVTTAKKLPAVDMTKIPESLRSLLGEGESE